MSVETLRDKQFNECFPAIRHIQGQAHSGAFWLRVNSDADGMPHNYIPINVGESQAAVVDYQTRLTTTTDGPPPPPVLQAVRTSDRRTITVRPLDYKVRCFCCVQIEGEERFFCSQQPVTRSRVLPPISPLLSTHPPARR